MAAGSQRTDSPRSRGWTRLVDLLLARLLGFPALAGMDPLIPTIAPGMDGIPRARGDGPLRTGQPHVRVQDSPRSRGWTPCPLWRPASRCGFPALAGMDRIRPCSRAIRLWIPRARGDGPCSDRSRPHVTADSPRSRGWTCCGPSEASRRRGFPALAGMDLVEILHGLMAPWIPRARGDGPPRRRGRHNPIGDSPRSRGWTRGCSMS